jgi:dolichyl-phosphate beta-glucosyltransferase
MTNDQVTMTNECPSDNDQTGTELPLQRVPATFSLIIPAYNEAQRLPSHLSSVRSYLRAEFSDNYEVIVVDDGSADGTENVLREMAPNWQELVVLRHSENRGKGAAVRTGMLAARGGLLLFADADGAAPIQEERRLRAAIEAGADMAVGSRLVDGAKVTRSWTRTLMVYRVACCVCRSVIRSAGSRCSAASPEGGSSGSFKRRATCSIWSFWSWPAASATK